ncbi:MAG: hypothetical protein KDE22_14300 [Rhodobacterales bacterium]|nr:hypothetical protein [Rhodobacterales bacterium]
MTTMEAGAVTGGLDEAARLAADGEWAAVAAQCQDLMDQGEGASEVLYLSALAFAAHEDFASAIGYAEKAFSQDSEVAEVANLLSVLHAMVGDLSNSSFYGKMATVLPSSARLAGWALPDSLPDFSSAFLNVVEDPLLRRAVAALDAGKWLDAEHWFNQHIQIHTASRMGYLGLANCLMVTGRFQSAAETLRAAMHMLPGDAAIAGHLGAALTAIGDKAAGRALHDWAMGLDPDDAGIAGQAAQDALMDTSLSADAITAIFRAWGARHGVETLPGMPVRTAGPRDRLTIGYLVGNLGGRRAGPALARILARHPSRRYRLVGFGFGPLSAATNMVFQKAFEGWHDVRDTDPITFGSLVTTEEVDILIDATGFAMPQHLSAFGQRMAPVQVAWLGSRAGTGLAGMDAIVSDPVFDPEGADRSGLVETPVSLPSGASLIDLPKDEGPAGPQAGERPLTFVADASLAEINPATASLWARILHALPESQLLLRDREFRVEVNAERLVALFGNFGVSHRIDVLSGVGDSEFFRSGDIALMPVPALRWEPAVDALWAGLPVINGQTGPDDSRAWREVTSVLAGLGLAGECQAATIETYVQLALDWAADADRRAAFAGAIRGRMEQAPLLDTARRATDLETVYESLWDRACGG